MLFIRRAPAARQAGLFLRTLSTNTKTWPGAPLSFDSAFSANAGDNKSRSMWFLFESKSSKLPMIDAPFERTLPRWQSDVNAQPLRFTEAREAAKSKKDSSMFNIIGKEALAEANKQTSLTFLTKPTAGQEKLQKVIDSLLGEFEETVVASLSKTGALRMMNRNARAPKKANRGRRPCSHVARRSKRLKRHKGW